MPKLGLLPWCNSACYQYTNVSLMIALLPIKLSSYILMHSIKQIHINTLSCILSLAGPQSDWYLENGFINTRHLSKEQGCLMVGHNLQLSGLLVSVLTFESYGYSVVIK